MKLLLSLLLSIAFGYDVEEDVETVETPLAPLGSRFQVPLDKPMPRAALDLRNLSLDDVWFETLMAIVLIATLIVYVNGKRINRDLARNWLKNASSVWTSNFAQLGTSGAKLVQDSGRDYIFYATGRVFVKHVYTYITLVARHDILQFLMERYLTHEHQTDTISMEATLNSEESDPIVFAIVPKSKSSKLRLRWDIDQFPKNIKDLPGFPKTHYEILCDAPEFAALVWSEPSIKKTIFKSLGLNEKGEGVPLKSPLIHELVLSDLPAVQPLSLDDFKKAEKRLRLVYELPETAALVLESRANVDQELGCDESDFTKLFLDVIDVVGQLGRLPPSAKAKVLSIRATAQEGLVRAQAALIKEDLEKKKYDQKRAKEEEVAKLGPEQQRKYEEKVRKQELKKKKSSMVKRS